MVAAAKVNPDLKKDLLMEPASSFHYINQSGCYELEGVDDRKSFDELCLALQILQVTPEHVNGIFKVLSAILWIGNLTFQDTENETCQLTSQDKITTKRIAFLLGLPEDKVKRLCTIRQINVRGTITDIALKYHEVSEVCKLSWKIEY